LGQVPPRVTPQAQPSDEKGLLNKALSDIWGFHRIRHYGLLAIGTGTRAEKLARAREELSPILGDGLRVRRRRYWTGGRSSAW
jgi:hypothetical protein